jgi:hypothetical protein
LRFGCGGRHAPRPVVVWSWRGERVVCALCIRDDGDDVSLGWKEEELGESVACQPRLIHL